MKVEKSQDRKPRRHFWAGFGIAMVLLVTTAMAYSYSQSPTFCGSCHAMTDHYTSWQMSTHRGVACTECHLPNDGMFNTLTAKAKTGIVDVYYQTVGKVPVTFHITAEGKEYLLDNCLRCHEAAVMNTSIIERGKECTSCHRDLVHKT